MVRLIPIMFRHVGGNSVRCSFAYAMDSRSRSISRMRAVQIDPAHAGDGATPAVHSIRKGAADAVAAYVAEHDGDQSNHDELQQIVDGIARAGSTPLVVAETEAGSTGAREQARVLGGLELKDIVKGGMRPRFDELRKMGIRTIMITGDNKLTAAAIAKEAGGGEFLGQGPPTGQMKPLPGTPTGGRRVAVTGGRSHDAPAP